MVDRASERRCGRELSRHTGRCLGHPGRHVDGADRRNLRARLFATVAKSTTGKTAEHNCANYMRVAKYITVFNIGLQNTFVYRWNYFLRALFGLIPLAGTVFLWRAIFRERRS